MTLASGWYCDRTSKKIIAVNYTEKILFQFCSEVGFFVSNGAFIALTTNAKDIYPNLHL